MSNTIYRYTFACWAYLEQRVCCGLINWKLFTDTRVMRLHELSIEAVVNSQAERLVSFCNRRFNKT